MGVHYLINHIHYPVHVPPRGTTIQSISFAAIHNHLKGVPCKWYHLENPKINNNIVQKSKWQFLQPTPIQPVEFNFGYDRMYVDLTGRTRKRATDDCPKWCGDFINKILLSSRRCYYYYWFQWSLALDMIHPSHSQLTPTQRSLLLAGVALTTQSIVT